MILLAKILATTFLASIVIVGLGVISSEIDSKHWMQELILSFMTLLTMEMIVFVVGLLLWVIWTL